VAALTKETGANDIHVRIRRIEQLYHTLDPHPFIERNHNEDAEEYIAEGARGVPKKEPFRIVFHMPPGEAAGTRARHLPETVRNFFAERADDFGRELRKLLREGRRHAIVGLAVLFVCVLLGTVVIPAAGIDRINFLGESLIILGWVANWKPMEIFLYEWQPLAADRRLYRRIAAAPVVITVSEGA
jgi:hypothetical protein